MVLLYLYLLTLIRIGQTYYDDNSVTPYSRHRITVPVPAKHRVEAMNAIMDWWHPEEGQKRQGILDIRRVVTHLNGLYASSVHDKKPSSAARMMTMCKDIFRDPDVKEMYKNRHEPKRNAFLTQLVPEASSYNAQEQSMKNFDLCSASFPTPHFVFDETAGTVDLVVTKTRSYTEIQQEWNVLMTELDEQVPKSLAKRKIGKLQHVTEMIDVLVHTFHEEKEGLQRFLDTANYMMAYYRTFDYLENVQMDVDAILELDRKIAETRDNNLVTEMLADMSRNTTNAYAKYALSFLSGPATGLIQETGVVGKVLAGEAAGILNTLFQQGIPTIVIVLLMMWSYRNLSTRNDTRLALEIAALKEELRQLSAPRRRTPTQRPVLANGST